MGRDTTTGSLGTGRDRNPLTWLVAAAAALLIAGSVGGFVLFDGEDEPAPPAARDEPSVTELTVPDRTAARCMVPNARALSNAEVAVDAVVVSIRDGIVTLDPSEWYAGEPTDGLQVTQASADRTALIGATRFEEGERYLVAGSAEGAVMVCGFSGPWSRDLAALYADAFGS